MNIFADLHTVAQTKRDMELIAEDIKDCNDVINAVMNELSEESYGQFVDELKNCADKMIEFADALFRTLVSALTVIGGIATQLTQADEEGRSSLNSSRAY